jgi:predicted nucleic acid-binding protein
VIVALDLNIVLDVLLERKEFLDSVEILLLAEAKKIEAIIPLHGITTIYYFSRKQMSDTVARQELAKLLKIVRVISISQQGVESAIVSPIADFEDAIVAETAIAANADYIITRNKRDFSMSPIIALTPDEFLVRYFTTH